MSGAGRIAVIGAGAWGTALAHTLGARHPDVALWVFEPELADQMAARRENPVYLPGIRLAETIHPTAVLERALAGRELVVLVPPSHAFRRVLAAARGWLPPDAILVSATKGLEVERGLTMSQVFAEVVPEHAGRLVVLSGPSFAREVGEGRPTAAVVAALDRALAASAQAALSGSAFRLYASTDPVGVEVCGAVKNVIAIAAGVVDGLELGTNARAALITRGLAEITRLAVSLGGLPGTCAGLAGMGDLILTCTGDLSRNRALGRAVGQGRSLDSLLAGSRSVAEGVNACRAVVQMAATHGVEMPICLAVHAVLFEGQPAREAVTRLMQRDLRFEAD